MGISVFEHDVTLHDDAVCTRVIRYTLHACPPKVPYKRQRKDEVNVICTYLGALLGSLCRTVPSSFIFLLCSEKDGQVKMQQRWELVAGNADRY